MSKSHDKLKSDKVLCSAGRGEVAKEACLACALKQENTCGYDYALLNALFKDKERAGIHVTDLTGCIRQAYYTKSTPPVEYVHDHLNRFIGSGLHSYIEGFESDEFTNEMPLAALGLVGTADVVYDNGRVVDFKTTRWLKINSLPYGSHAMQLNIYAALLRAQGKEVNSLAIQYIDLSGPSKCTTCKGPVKVDAEGHLQCRRCGRYLPNAHTGAHLVEIELEPAHAIREWIETRRTLLELSLDGTVPPDPEPSFLCDYCPFAQRCTNE